MPANFATTISARETYASGDKTVPADWFRHTSPTTKPSEPAVPGAMNREAHLQFLAWKANQLTLPVHPHARAKVLEFQAYYESADYKAWADDDRLQRIAQWRWRNADVLDATTETLPASGDTAGVGAGDVAYPIPISSR